jgi:hypothetical protein
VREREREREIHNDQVQPTMSRQKEISIKKKESDKNALIVSRII